mmetsp:Transcript_60176/g.166540  ORF Transcript_60176/g.166540 Transcript_60176/m.166540 type:complete len:247 (+) Transcript_60176:402-1142(+)
MRSAPSAQRAPGAIGSHCAHVHRRSTRDRHPRWHGHWRCAGQVSHGWGCRCGGNWDERRPTAEEVGGLVRGPLQVEEVTESAGAGANGRRSSRSRLARRRGQDRCHGLGQLCRGTAHAEGTAAVRGAKVGVNLQPLAVHNVVEVDASPRQVQPILWHSSLRPQPLDVCQRCAVPAVDAHDPRPVEAAPWAVPRQHSVSRPQAARRAARRYGAGDGGRGSRGSGSCEHGLRWSCRVLRSCRRGCCRW